MMSAVLSRQSSINWICCAPTLYMGVFVWYVYKNGRDEESCNASS